MASLHPAQKEDLHASFLRFKACGTCHHVLTRVPSLIMGVQLPKDDVVGFQTPLQRLQVLYLGRHVSIAWHLDPLGVLTPAAVGIGFRRSWLMVSQVAA